MSKQGTAQSYKVFVRNWWRLENGQLVPDPGARKTTIATRCTYDEARRICDEYRATHNPGRLSRKAEFTKAR